MARIKKKGKAGQAKNFITRTQAVRKLQVSLPDFRRLCIFKGIYPREPRNKKKASKTSGPNTTFYYSKDIQYLLHEPLLARFREHKAASKKIARSLGKGEVKDAARLDKTHNKKLSLDHIIKERYPTFVDALRDLDDALSLLFLFANLPSTSTVPARTIALCQRLCHEFQHYLIISHSLRKSFISIKGIYYQATIQGQDILWLVPHKFVQRVTSDVDFRIMGTFVEFYTTLLGFVNYRLYTTVGLVYPPKLDIKADEDGGELNALKLENRGLDGENEPATKARSANTPADANPLVDKTTQRRVEELDLQTATSEDAQDTLADYESSLTQHDNQGAIDVFETKGAGADLLPQPSQEPAAAGALFSGMVFFFNRETPRQPLEFLLRAFGARRIGWDAVLGSGSYTTDELDSSITHQIVDRPPALNDPSEQTAVAADDDGVVNKPKTFQHGFRVLDRTYVQPQWVWDCVNASKILRTDLYAPGALLPPHLSPFVKPKQGQYDPTKSLAEQEREGEVEEFEEAEREARALEVTEGNKVENEAVTLGEDDAESDNGMQIAASEDGDGDESDGNSGDEKGHSSVERDDFGGFSDEEHEVDDELMANVMHQAELEAEAQGLTVADVKMQKKGMFKVPNGNGVRRKAERKRYAEEEERNRRMGMMPRKKKKLFEKMQYGLKRDSDEAENLRRKRRILEQGNGSI